MYNNPATYTDPTGHFVVTLGSAVGYFVASHTWSDSAFHQRLSTTILAAGIAVVAGPHASAAVIAAGTSLVINAALTGHIQGPEVRAAAFAAVSAQFAEEIGHGTGLEGQGWVIDKCMTTSLVSRAMIKAYNHRQSPKSLVFHRDRGSQYTSKSYVGC